jgi:hypothetical protein
MSLELMLKDEFILKDISASVLAKIGTTTGGAAAGLW